MARCFAAGLLSVLPLILTIAAISWTISFLAGIVGPETFLGGLLSRIGLRFATEPTVAYILGWVGIGLVILLVGFLVESGLRGLIHRVAETVLRRIPLIGKVYDTSQQLVNMIDMSGDDKLQGMSVVYCSFGEKGGVGVLALLPTKEPIILSGKPHYVVLVPQSPIPIGGGLLFMPIEAVERIEMSVDVLMSIYVSMGAVAPIKMNPPTSKLPAN